MENRDAINAYKLNRKRTHKREFIAVVHRNMRKRTRGKCKSPQLYLNLEVVEFYEFIEWALKDEALERLWQNWQINNHIRKLTPSIDRMDPAKGYELSNLRWITTSENCAGGGHGRKKKYYAS